MPIFDDKTTLGQCIESLESLNLPMIPIVTNNKVTAGVT